MICIARHIKAYHRQCFDREIADFGEPCSDCEFCKTCKFDWFARMKPLFENTNITIQLGRQGHSSKKNKERKNCRRCRNLWGNLIRKWYKKFKKQVEERYSADRWNC